MKKVVLALDPSGAYNEGKGTTGWCLMDTKTKEVIHKGALYAEEYHTDIDYWKAHLDLVRRYEGEFPMQMAVVIEDYLLYAEKADSQINSRFETSQLIGVLKYWCTDKGIPVYMQTAGEVKNRWANPVLQGKGIIALKGRTYELCCLRKHINRHELDALRHALHFSYFYNT